MGIVPRDSPAEVKEHPIGAGPFRLIGAAGLSSIQLEAHDGYHQGAPGVRGLRLRIIPDATTRCLELRRGSVDLVLNSIPPDALPSLAADPHLRVVSAPGSTYWYLGLNLKDPVLAQPAVREALAHAIDRDAIVTYLLGGRARKASGPLPPENPFAAADLKRFDFDPTRSRALLDEAGFPEPDGDGPRPRLHLVLSTSTDDLSRLQALAMADMLRSVGIEIEVRSYEFATFFADIRAGRFQMFTLRWVGITDPDWFENTFHSSRVPPGGSNRGSYASPEVDRLLVAARSEMDVERRRDLYDQVQRHIAQDLPYVSLVHADIVAVSTKRVRGIELYVGGDFTPLRRIRLDGD